MLRALSTRIVLRSSFMNALVLGSLYAICIAELAFLAYRISQYTGSFRIIELEPLWHPGAIIKYFTSLPAEGIFYIEWMLLVDMANILVYSLLFSVIISWLHKKTKLPAGHPRMLLNLAPFIMAAFDLAENLLMHLSIAEPTARYAMLLNLAILLKLAAGALCMLIIFLAAASFAKRKK